MWFRNNCSKREAWHPGRNCPLSKHVTLRCKLRDYQFIRSDLETAVVKGREINAARGVWDSPGWWFPGGLGWLCSSAGHRRRWQGRGRWIGRGGTTSWRIGGCWTAPWPWEGAEEAEQLVNLVEGFCLHSACSPKQLRLLPRSSSASCSSRSSPICRILNKFHSSASSWPDNRILPAASSGTWSYSPSSRSASRWIWLWTILVGSKSILRASPCQVLQHRDRV